MWAKWLIKELPGHSAISCSCTLYLLCSTIKHLQVLVYAQGSPEVHRKTWDRTKTILLIYFLLRQTNWSKLIKQVSKSPRAFEQEIKINHISEVLISSHTKTAFSPLLRTHFYITPLNPEKKRMPHLHSLTEATVQFSYSGDWSSLQRLCLEKVPSECEMYQRKEKRKYIMHCWFGGRTL